MIFICFTIVDLPLSPAPEITEEKKRIKNIPQKKNIGDRKMEKRSYRFNLKKKIVFFCSINKANAGLQKKFLILKFSHRNRKKTDRSYNEQELKSLDREKISEKYICFVHGSISE